MTLNRINLSGIGRKTEKAKIEYPILDTPRAIELADVILQLSDEAEAINANLDINKADLRSVAGRINQVDLMRNGSLFRTGRLSRARHAVKWGIWKAA